MKKILCITATRADFGKLKPLLHYLDKQAELHVIVTGMHMLPLYGHTYLEVQREQFQHMYFMSNQLAEDYTSAVMAKSISLVTRLVHQVNPDLILVHGDRVEALAGAIVGALENILICHIEGGELSGTIDDSIRHAISKFAHIHMVSNVDAQQRLVQMGEDPSHIYVIGSPDLDIMRSPSLPSLEVSKKYYEIPFEHYAISLFHPVTTEYSEMERYTEYYFEALKQSKKNYIIIYPNNDLGSHFIHQKIQQIQQQQMPYFRCFPSLRFEYFLTLLKHCEFMIGNSSAGVREAPFYGVTSVNVGTRQNTRASASSIINCEYSVKAILEAINLVEKVPKGSINLDFGQGDSTQLFKQYFEHSHFWDVPLQKKFYSSPLY